MQKLTVNLDRRSYEIVIGAGILVNLGTLLRRLGIGDRVLLVSNPTVSGLYGQVAAEALAGAGYSVTEALVPDGERYKNLETIAGLYDRAVAAGLDRSSAVVALGGGVIGDIAGFLAATFMRGLFFIQVPTTLLAQVDSSVGGKVGVNHEKGKNLIGAFYQPRIVVADVAVLKTLPERELRAGLAEVIKYGVIGDGEFFTYLEQNRRRVLALDPETTIEVVRRSCLVKSRVVEQDECEAGLRAILNFGHTLGHAVETLTRYEQYRHGEAVAIGMIGAANLAVTRGLLSGAGRDRLLGLIRETGLPVTTVGLSPEQIGEAVKRDKKVRNGRLRLVLPEAIGRVRLVDDLSPEEILAAAATICRV